MISNFLRSGTKLSTTWHPKLTDPEAVAAPSSCSDSVDLTFFDGGNAAAGGSCDARSFGSGLGAAFAFAFDFGSGLAVPFALAFDGMKNDPLLHVFAYCFCVM